MLFFFFLLTIDYIVSNFSCHFKYFVILLENLFMHFKFILTTEYFSFKLVLKHAFSGKGSSDLKDKR